MKAIKEIMSKDKKRRYERSNFDGIYTSIKKKLTFAFNFG